MAIYKTCDRCGANLDPGEQCDCDKPQKRKIEKAITHPERNARGTIDRQTTTPPRTHAIVR